MDWIIYNLIYIIWLRNSCYLIRCRYFDQKSSEKFYLDFMAEAEMPYLLGNEDITVLGLFLYLFCNILVGSLFRIKTQPIKFNADTTDLNLWFYNIASKWQLKNTLEQQILQYFFEHPLPSWHWKSILSGK